MTRVLLAEDDASISEPLARALRREGYEVEVREDGPTALDAGIQGGVDLVVLDTDAAPGALAGAWIARLKERRRGVRLPVVVLTDPELLAGDTALLVQQSSGTLSLPKMGPRLLERLPKEKREQEIGEPLGAVSAG